MAFVLILLLILAAGAEAASVATWRWEAGGFSVEISYLVDVNAAVDKAMVLIPGEEVTLFLRATGGVLEVTAKTPFGGPVHYTTSLPPDSPRRFRVEVVPGVALAFTAEMALWAEVRASGAQPPYASARLPSDIKFKTWGGVFNVTYYAAPVISVEVEIVGKSMKVYRTELARKELRPGNVVYVSVFPWPAVLAGAAAVGTAVYLLKRRVKKKDKDFYFEH